MNEYQTNFDFDEKSDKVKDLENESDWVDGSNGLLNCNLWAKTIPIEILYPNNSPNNLPNTSPNNSLNNSPTNSQKKPSKVSNKSDNNSKKVQKDLKLITAFSDKSSFNNLSDLSINFDDFIRSDLCDNSLFSLGTDENLNESRNNNQNLGNDNTLNNNNNNMFNHNNKNIDISEWLKEQNKKATNCNDINDSLSSTELGFYNYNNNIDNYNDKNFFNFLNSPTTFSSSLPPNTFSSSTIGSKNNTYNSPLTCVLLSPPFFSISSDQQPSSKALTSISGLNQSSQDSGSSKKAKTSDATSIDSSFDPSKRCFSLEELKVSQIIPKSQKKFVPNEKKDPTYWSRRQKNNKAAKRSREAKRVKENQITMRTAFLEEENIRMRADVNKLMAENKHLRVRLAKYEIYEAKFDVN